ncbi:hypothetical protein [Undibacterium crateris]|uniref:hypothetical protein n=1 Tax=Undibacterium crateris TaxID=2528175 RepID=UPI00138975D4|nr:hypothetical protein [Undibacterium crateris]NDI85473.1 hypothetical protein [Undibacterium crateris]
MLLHSTILRLLSGRLDKLAQNHFFSKNLSEYVAELQALLSKLRADYRDGASSALPPDALQLVVESIWRATQYLAGSTSNRVPYELVFALRNSLIDWGLDDCVVTTSLLQSSEFLCERVHSAPNDPIEQLLETKMKFELVQIALPEIFQHTPLFCTPLYHEIGHYVEERKRLVTGALTSNDQAWLECLPDAAYVNGIDDRTKRRKVALNLITEHFCDTFAASYVGSAACFYIEEWAPDQPANDTHPSTMARIAVIEEFLNEGHGDFINMLQNTALDNAGKPLLIKRFDEPEVEKFYSDSRPCEITSIAQMHGVFPAALKQLKSSIADPAKRRAFPNDDDLILAVNDLTEKSIRNFMIRNAWDEPLDQA